jgi:chemotaxis protein methyltransferase CheR
MACSDLDYAYLREVVLAQSANLIDPSRNTLFETRLEPIARVAGVGSVEGLVSLLRADRPAHLQRAVAEAMTINETSFFRDVKVFDVVRTLVIPRLMALHRSTARLRIWSAASSTGQEAYSLAMLLLESFPELAEWDVKIIATDISRPVVDYARAGRFRRIEVNRGLRARLLLKYFERDGEQWQICPSVRNLCEFRVASLCAPLPSLPIFDLVLLRNVLLYFPQQDRTCVLTEVHRQMSPQGILVLGNAEQAEDSTDLFQVEFAEDTYFYRPAPTA